MLAMEASELQRAVFDLVDASLHGGGYVEVGDWEAVFAEMKAQSVAGLPGRWLRRHPIDGASAWNAHCARVRAGWVRVMHAQDGLLRLFAEAGIPCAIVKGAAASMAYPAPSMRSMGDVDVLVTRRDVERAASVMEGHGYALSHEKDPKMHHYGYRKGGVEFELHRRLCIVSETDERLLSLFEEGVERAETGEAEGYEFPVLPAHLNGSSLVFHMNQHLRSGLGLRHLVDWMEYADACDAHVWEGELLPLLRRTGTERLALTATATCQRYLGLRQIIGDGDYPCEALMRQVMGMGNFGRKSGGRDKVASFIAGAKGVPGVLRRLQDGGMGRWEAARRHPILRPFAWAYQSARIAGTMIRGEVGTRGLSEQWREGLGRRELLEALGLDVDKVIPED